MNEKVNLGSFLGGLVIGILSCAFISILLNASSIRASRQQLHTNTPESESVVSTKTASPKNTKRPTLTPRPTRTRRPTPIPEYGSMDYPVRFGESLGMIWDNTSEFEVSIVSVIRGQEALGVVLNENRFNEIPAEGMEYIVFVARIARTGNDSEILEFSEYFWGVLSNGRVFDWTLSVCCFDGVKIARGGVADETVALQVYVDDENPLLVFGEKFYFKTR